MAINSIKKTTVSGVTLATSTDNQVATVTGANALTGESNLTFDGTDLAVGNGAPSSYIDSVHGVIVGDTGDATSEIVLAASTTGVAEINFTDTADTTNQGQILYDHTSNFMSFDTAGSEAMRIESSGDLLMATGNNIKIGGGATILSIDATDDHTNANMSQGITLNQGASDNEIFALKSSDVAHGITTRTETDTFYLITKNTANNGGALIRALADTGSIGFLLRGHAPTDDTAKSTAGTAYVGLEARKTNGTSDTQAGTNANILYVSNGGQTRFVVDAEGDVHYDATTNANAWDDHDDLGLLNTVRNLTTGNNAQHIFGAFVSENAQILHDTGVITMNDDGHHFISTKGLNALIIDTIRQEGQKWRTAMDQRDSEIAELRGELMRLQERNN